MENQTKRSNLVFLAVVSLLFLWGCTFKEKEERVISEAEKVESEKQQRISNGNAKFKENCYNPVDGSCYAVVHYVKQNMNDPESFQHSETQYSYNDSCIEVLMKFRGNNAFGGKVINYVKAKVSRDCELLEIKQIEQ